MCQGQAPPRRQPTASPPFTIGTLRKAIPPHCFDRSLLRSSAYLGADLAAVAVLYLCATLFSHPAVPALVRWGVLWPAYWVLQGAVCTGLWVIAHECGHQVREMPLNSNKLHFIQLLPGSDVSCSHLRISARQAFSKYQTVNDAVGLVVHTCLLVPYYSW